MGFYADDPNCQLLLRTDESVFSFEKLDVWQQSLNFADSMFELADSLPQRYQFSLGEQMRRAALSIPTNIAEGSGRQSLKEQAYFYNVAKGSVYEVVSLLAITGKRGFLQHSQYLDNYQQANEIAAMLGGLIKSTHNRLTKLATSTKNSN